MALAGTLRDFGLPDIVQLIGLQRKTGTLFLKSEGETVKVLFDGGNIVGAESSVARPSDRIGNALVSQGSITKDQLDQALSVQKQTMQRLGHVLISEDMVSEDVLRQAVEAQLFQVVFRLFRWREGEYNFEVANNVDYEKMGSVSLGADFILMEGIRMVDEWPIIERRIPSMASVFKKVVDPDQVQTKGEEGDLDGLLSSLGSSQTGGNKIALSGDELMVYNAVDGRKSCTELVESTPLHDFAVCRTLLDLMDRDVVALTDVKGSTARSTSGGAAGAVSKTFMVVALLVAVFGVYKNLASPFAVFGLSPLIQPLVDSSRETRLLERIELAESRVRGFRLAYGRLPSSLDELVAEGFASKSSVEGLTMTNSISGFAIQTAGPNGEVRIERTYGLTGVPQEPAASVSPSPSPSPQK